MNRRRAFKRPSIRQAEICDLVSRCGAVSVDDLAEKFDISSETIRRDLTVLADARKIRKVHGGARPVSQQDEGVFDTRMRRNAVAKRRIAEKLVAHISPRQSLFLDTGSTTLICAEILARIKDLTIITNSAKIAAIFAKGSGGADVFLLGGRYREDNAQTVGGYALDQIKHFRADNAIITIGGLDCEGAMDFSSREAQIARAMMGASAKVTIVADHTKFNRSASFNVCDLDEINMLISNKPPDLELGRAMSAAGIEVC